MQTTSFDYSIRDAEGAIVSTATWVNTALDAGAAEHERTGEVVSVHAPDGTEVAWYGEREVAPMPQQADSTETPDTASRSIAAFAGLHAVAWDRRAVKAWHDQYGTRLATAARECDDNLLAVQAALMQGQAGPTLADHLHRALEDRRKLDRAEAAWRAMSQALADLYV